LTHLHLDGLQDRLPSELSGGQRQRVALAQSLSRSPDVLLLDEPFSALDAPVRRDLRRELRRLQRETGVTTVLVTHDPEEAAYLADELIVLSHGRSLQSGVTRDVFGRPTTPEVAHLLGIANLHPAVVIADAMIEAGEFTLAVMPTQLPPGTPILWSVRPERVVLSEDGIPGTITEIADTGTAFDLFIALDDEIELQAFTTDDVAYVIGDSCYVSLAPEAITVWPKAEGAAI
jgi:molybdate transport system permease protein